VLIAGVAFFTLRMLFLPLPFLGLRPRAKQWAAAGTLVAISAYLCITGFEISALRAYVMMVLILLSVLLLREVDAMRSLALAACIMLLLDPSDVLEPGFQLSFIATMAMIAAVEKHLNRPLHQTAGNIWKFPMAALGTFLLFSISAELATAPLVASMFNQFSLYGILANFLAGPLVSFLIMPAVALYFVSYPFGLEAPVLSLLGYGIDGLLALAAWISSLPHALHYVVAHPAWGVVLYVAGVLWLCLWQGRWRWWGVPMALLGAVSFLSVRVPDAVISSDMKTIALRHEGEMYLLRGRPTAMVPTIIANGVGKVSLQPPKAISFMQCEGALCTYRASSMTLLVATAPMLYSRVCGQAQAVQADLVVSVNRILYCPEIAPVLDGRARARNGAYAVWRTSEGLRLETTRGWQGERPWASQ
jgi:competence protein ComEC